MPPPLPSAETALATYLKAAGTIVPALFVWLFSNAFLLPKLEWLWQQTNLTGSKAQSIMDASYFLAHGMQFVFGVVVILLVLLELRAGTWPRYRRTVISIVAVLFHTTVLIGLASITTAVLIAAPLLTKTK